MVTEHWPLTAIGWYSQCMLYRKPRVGGEIESYCGTCKEERTHIIAAMDGDIVAAAFFK